MGQAEEHDVAAVGSGVVDFGERQVTVVGGEARVEVGDGSPRLGIASGDHHVEVRMGGTEPQQFRPGEPRGADDPDCSHPESIRTLA